MKHYYAGRNTYGINFALEDGNAWHVYQFDSKKERDEWVKDDDYRNGNPTRDIITAKDARRVTGQWTDAVQIPHDLHPYGEEWAKMYPSIKYLAYVKDYEYYNPKFWG